MENRKVIDLTLTIDEQLPCTWPPHMPFQKKNWNWYQPVEYLDEVVRDNKLGPYYVEWLIMDEHIGTHFNAPSHFIPKPGSGLPNEGPAGAITGDQVELNTLIGEAVVIDLTSLCGQGENGQSPYIQPEQIIAWEQEHGELKVDEIVLFYTGWDRFYQPGSEGKKYAYNPLMKKVGPGWPAPDVEVMKYLYEKGITTVGTDGASMGSSHNGAPVHVYGLGKGMSYVEGLCNLGQLKGRGTYFIFLPLKISNSSGSPGRAIGLVRS